MPPFRATPDDAYRVDFKSVAGRNLIAVGGQTTQADVAVETQLSIGEVVDAGIVFQYPLNKDRLKLLFLLLFASFQQGCNLLPGNSLRIHDAHDFFMSIPHTAFHYRVWQCSLLK